MIKVIDVDKLFDEYISDYVYKNIGKVKPEEIENNMPILYAKFGKEECKELDGKSPETYYSNYTTSELLECLKEHIKQDVSVSDFLCEAITDKKEGDVLVKELMQDNGEEYTVYLINMLGEMGGEIPCKRYLEFALYDESQSISELATEALSLVAEMVKEDILNVFNTAPENRKVNLVEILSNTKNDDRVFDILVAEFSKNQDNIPTYAGYLSKFGDERAIPFLMTAIENEKISYVDFEELRFAIESLGGEYNKKRDFSNDKLYKRIKGKNS